MKKILTLILTVITVGFFAQKIKPHNQDTTDMLRQYRKDSLYIKPAYLAQGVLPFSGNSVYSMGNKTLYSIKPDGSIELGDLIIEAIIKALEKKGYRLMKKPNTFVVIPYSHF